MKIKYLIIPILFSGIAAYGQPVSANKKAVLQSVDKHQADLIGLSNRIWSYAETAFEETRSSKELADYAEQQGFRVERGVAGMPTAFIASYGSGSPIIGVLGEFDALPGVSQKAVPTKDPLTAGAPGHGCGHNLFGPGSLGAAIAVKELMQQGKIKGTIRFYGTPAEEKFFGKLYFARAGLFNDLDVCLDWHPSATTQAEMQSTLAVIDFLVEFRGQSAHASLDPWNGRSAVDGLEFYTQGLNYLREHVRPSVRMHYQIQHGGDVVNIVPDYARIWTRIRDARRTGMDEVYQKAERIARGAAMMADVDYSITLISGIHEVLVNRTGGTALHKNLVLLGDIEYTPEEEAFAKAIQEATGKVQSGMNGKVGPLEETRELTGGASSDVGDVSWIVPEIRLSVSTAPVDTPWHSWAVVACGGMSIGHKGMTYAAKALGMTMVDLFEQPQLVQEIQKEFKERKGAYVYKAILPDGPPPVPGK